MGASRKRERKTRDEGEEMGFLGWVFKIGGLTFVAPWVIIGIIASLFV
jgi:hypothetical protein